MHISLLPTVSNPPDGLNGITIRTEFAAQRDDMDIHRTLRDTDVFSLGCSNELVACEDPPWPPRQHVQHAKLHRRQQDRLALHQYLMAPRVQHQCTMRNHDVL